MHRSHHIALAALGAALLVACSDRAPTAPAAPARDVTRSEDRALRIRVTDSCEPESFNAALGPGTCLKEGEVTFERFIAELTATHRVRAWHNRPRELAVEEGQRIRVTNTGGEVHTFTEVEHFGGGIVPLLNDLAGTPEVAPECQQLAPDDFLAPGSSFSFVEGEEEDAAAARPAEEHHSDAVERERYQCCIHPWMRTTLLVRE